MKRMNIGKLLSLTAQRWSHNLAIVQGDVQRTYGEFNSRSNALAKALKELGIRKGDRIALFAYNSPQYLDCVFAAFKMGTIIVPLNARFVADEAQYHINDSRAAAVIFDDDKQRIMTEIKNQIPSAEHLICIGKPQEDQLGLEALISINYTSEDQTVEVEKDDLAWLFYTSGTTGRPKGAMLSHSNLMAMILNYLADTVPATRYDHTLHIGALSHGAGLHALSVVTKGAIQVLLPSHSFDIPMAFALIEKWKITNMFMAPTMINMFVHHPDIDKYDLSSLKYIFYGGSPMYVEDLRFAIKKLGPIFIQGFGQGESPMTGTRLSQEEHVLEGNPEELKRLSSAGRPQTGIEIRIVDENENELHPGQMGEICIRGETVMQGYWERPEETEKTLKRGWLHTGDIGFLDKHGYLYVMDRLKDMYISGGMNVYPREIEEIILTQPAIKACAVIGVPDEKWGEVGKAICVLKKGEKATEEQIIEYCRSRMAGYKLPKSVEFLDSLPMSAYGKILKKEIGAKFWSGHERMIAGGKLKKT